MNIKMILSVITFLSLSSVNAAVLQKVDVDTTGAMKELTKVRGDCVGETCASMQGMSTSTTSLPTLIVLDDEVAVNSNDIESLLLSEVDSDYTPLTDALARELGVTTAMVQAAIAELMANGEAITVENIKLLVK